MKKLYVCTEDRQGGTFAVGSIMSIEGWRQRALSWADSDDNEYLLSAVQSASTENVIPLIDNEWSITLEPLDNLIPMRYSVIEDMLDLVGYISNNIAGLRTMQKYLEDNNEEYSRYINTILNEAMRITGNIFVEDEQYESEEN